MQTADEIYRVAADLYWIAFLITGSTDRASTAVLNELENSSTLSSSRLSKVRRAVIVGALVTVHGELALSAVRLEHRQSVQSALPSRNWSLDPNTSKAQLQEALLAIDLFPRCALLLTVFEGFEIDDATLLLHTDPASVTKGRIAGLFELTRNLASLQGWRDERGNTWDSERETQYA